MIEWGIEPMALSWSAGGGLAIRAAVPLGPRCLLQPRFPWPGTGLASPGLLLPWSRRQLARLPGTDKEPPGLWQKQGLEGQCESLIGPSTLWSLRSVRTYRRSCPGCSPSKSALPKRATGLWLRSLTRLCNRCSPAASNQPSPQMKSCSGSSGGLSGGSLQYFNPRLICTI